MKMMRSVSQAEPHYVKINQLYFIFNDPCMKVEILLCWQGNVHFTILSLFVKEYYETFSFIS